METQLSAMCASKCASGEWEARQELKRVQRLLDNQCQELRQKDALLRSMREQVEVLEADRSGQKELIDQLDREKQECGQEKASLAKSPMMIEISNAKIQAMWPSLATVYANGARNAEMRDARGFRWDQTMRDLVLRAQIVPKAVWKEFSWGSVSRPGRRGMRYSTQLSDQRASAPMCLMANRTTLRRSSTFVCARPRGVVAA
jgi:hypothetical protein